jgi:hypothetical protein
MTEQKSAKLRPGAESVLAAAKTFNRALSQFAINSLTRYEVRFAGIGGPKQIDEIVLIIRSATLEEANRHGMELQNAGCTCQSNGETSTGETEVECHCPDPS